MDTTHKQLLLGIFIISLAGLLGSLYFSSFGDPVNNLWLGELFNPANGLVPCSLCWWARILLYPIVPISGIGLLKNDARSVNYLMPFAILGIPLEMYHYAIQKLAFPVLTNCASATPCTSIQVEYFGFVTIPLLGFVAFATITVLCVVFLKRART